MTNTIIGYSNDKKNEKPERWIAQNNLNSICSYLFFFTRIRFRIPFLEEFFSYNLYCVLEKDSK